MNKKNLGQFFTTNVNYILEGFEELIKNKNIIDPFCGNGDLLKWSERNGSKSTIGFDIDQTLLNEKVHYNDSLIAIPSKGELLLTNPPYLAKNKMSNELKTKYFVDDYIDDFYLLAIKRIINSNLNEGIIIIPINFFSAENSDKIRVEFLSKFKIGKIKYFTNQVFEDTTYNVVAFYFERNNDNEIRKLHFNILPKNENYSFTVEKKFNYKIAGRELFEITNTKCILKPIRLLDTHIKNNFGKNKLNCFFNDYNNNRLIKVNDNFKVKINNNIILLNCIDGKLENKICAENIKTSYNKSCLIGKNTSRNIAYVLIDNVSIEDQNKIIKSFNEKLNELRIKYNSLFLTNFRDGNRKRISFDFCYKLINYCYNKLIKENDISQ